MNPPVLPPSSPLLAPKAPPIARAAPSLLKRRSVLWIVATVVALAIAALSAMAWRALNTSDPGEGFVSGNGTPRSNTCWS